MVAIFLLQKWLRKLSKKKIFQNSLFLETELKKDERDFETVNNLVEEGTLELIQTITNFDYEPIFDNMINVNDWTDKIKEDQEIRKSKLDNKIWQQNFNAVADAMIQKNHADILPRMLANNKIRDSFILEKTIMHRKNKISSWLPKSSQN